MTTETIEGVVGQVTTIAGYDEGLPNVHRLKSESPYFAELWSGAKTYELRIDDRDYRIGDLLMLCEYSNDPSPSAQWPNGKYGRYSGRFIIARVKSMIDGDSEFADVLRGDVDGDSAFVVLGIMEVSRAEYRVDRGRYE
jgi:hypothetical protein